MSEEEDSDSEEAEWEELDASQREVAVLGDLPLTPPLTTSSSSSSSQALEIVLSRDGQGKKSKKQHFFERALAAYKRRQRILIHKTHLLCLTAHARLLSAQCDSSLLQAVLLSLTPLDKYDHTNLVNETTLISLVRWFQSTLVNVRRCVSIAVPQDQTSNTQLVVGLLRALGVRTRLVLALDPCPLKDQAVMTTVKQSTSRKRTKIKQATSSSSGQPTSASPGPPPPTAPAMKTKRRGKKGQQQSTSDSMNEAKDHSPLADVSSYFQHDQSSDDDFEEFIPPQSKRSLAGKLATLRSDDSKGKRSKKKGTPASRPKQQRRSKRLRQDTPQSSPPEGSSPSSPSKRSPSIQDGASSPPSKRLKHTPASPQSKRRSSSTGSETSSSLILHDGLDPDTSSGDPALYDDTTSWIEVYTERRQWRSLHLPSLSFGQPHLCEKHCPRGLSYVIAVDNDGKVSDVTARYAYRWCTHTQKLRIDSAWWDQSLSQHRPPALEVEEEENDIRDQLMSYPLPVNMQDYKNHPLYALKRHLLKFEAIYPADSQILGHFKSEPIYSRDCIHLLHTRESWMKEGRVVKTGETPYNVVKGRKKRGQTTLEASNNSVEVYGKWQTEHYIPPPVVDGRVPRNEYGNIELFQASMLPEGAVHMTVPGIAKVARKLEIDYAPAMMGWDFHSGYCHPIIDGIVVAKEWERPLLEAWEQEREVVNEKQQEKREKKVICRWMKLTRGLLIRERVKQRFEAMTSS